MGRAFAACERAGDHARVLALVVLANLEALARFRADRPTAWVGSEGFTAHAPNSGTPDQGAWLDALTDTCRTLQREGRQVTRRAERSSDPQSCRREAGW